MPIVNPSITQFNTGEITPFLMGRTDFKKYAAAAEYMENCLPLVYGPFVKRSGTRYVTPIKYQGKKTILKPFIFSREQAYVLEFGVGYIRFHTKYGTILMPDGSGNILEVKTPFEEKDLDNLDFAQSNDFLYIASGRFPVKLLKRYGHQNWTLENLEFEDGPYQDENTNKGHTMTATIATEGSATTITSSVDYFTQDMVGMHLRLRKVAVGSSSEDAIGWITITSVSNSKTAQGLVESKLFEANLSTYAWRLSEFSKERGYPKKVALFKGRLCFASTEKMPNTIWLSKSDSYHNFGPTDMNANEVQDDCAIYMTMAANETNKIQWMTAMRQLFIGTLGAEFKIGQMNEVLKPSTATSEEVSQYGSTPIKPCKYANELIYIQQAERKVRTMYYDLSTDAYNSQDLSLFGEHLTFGGIAGMSQQIEPFSTLWIWLKTGELRTISYEKSQEVCAWGRVVLGGEQVKVLSVATIPYSDENRDQTWLLVERYINGRYVQYIEVAEKVFDDSVNQEQGYFVDCGGTYDNPINIENIYAESSYIVIYSKNHGLLTGMKVRFNDIKVNGGENDPYSEDMSTWDYSILNGTSHYITRLDEHRFAVNFNSSEWIPYLNWQGGVYRVYVDEINGGLEYLEGQEVYAVVDGAVSEKRVVTNGTVHLDSPGVIVHVGLPYKCKYKSVRLDIAMGQNNALASKQKIHHLYIKTYRTNYFKYGGETADTLMPARRYTIDSMDKAPELRSELCEIAFEAPWGREPKATIESDLPVPLCILSITTQESLNQ